MPDPSIEVLQNFLGGMNSNIDPQLLPTDKYSFGLNVTSRGGLPKTRPPFVKVDVDLPDGKFQGASLYRLNDVDRIVFGVAGRVYALRLDTMAIIDYGPLLSSSADRFYFVQADRFFIIQDGIPGNVWADQNWPVILHEDTRIDQHNPGDYHVENEYERVPKGGPMAYGHGRLFVATNYILENPTSGWINNGRVGWMAGDIKLPYRPESLLEFTETWNLDEGGRFDLPEELSFITAMAFQHNIMSGVGQGPLIVWARNGASAFMVNAPRNTWKQIDFSVVLWKDVGTDSHLSLVHNNSDILYRATDGIRTLAQTTADLQGKALANDPISEAVDSILDDDDLGTLPLVSGAKHDDRLFWTAVPEGDYFTSILSLDVKPIATFGSGTSPVYDGVWTGLRFQHIIEAIWNEDRRLFAFCEASDGSEELYVLDEGDYIDQGQKRPVCRIYTPYLQFNSGIQIKRLDYIDLWISDVIGQVDIAAYFRPDYYALWIPLEGGTINASPAGYPQNYRRLRLPIAGTVEANVDGNLLDRGAVFQFCIEWTGHAKIDKMMFVASIQDAETYRVLAAEDGEPTTLQVTGTQQDLDDYTYRIN